ncbi:squalene/phytoene synthase family protein [Sphingomonas sp. CFBP 13603]|uniref:squalene/phytoene synthase family protein n=1 Tax=Sphingomonas sp. CFBP 13603 TaxID=2774040 RepID=UPI0018691C3F|nr:squalene/phytoene synthase family protein [Sphingomonas sp. CFBP 13603]MBE2992118.1 squalene/phytoene synthase family protein [Sphingomonas sp. CFBP 13603]
MTSIDPGRALALSYAPPATRAGLEALFALDDRLATIVRSTREPMVGQMRLTWWHEALTRLQTAPVPQEPVLQSIKSLVLTAGVSGSSLAAMTDGWEILLQAEIDTATLEAFAIDRGGRLFEVAARMLGIDDRRIGLAGEGWALVDLARGLTDTILAGHARTLATTRFDAAFRGRWPRAARSLGALALLARFENVAALSQSPGPTRRIARLMLHRLAGY